MNNKKMGDLIAELRKQKNMTQKDLADRLNVTDKAVSKWERGISCPDIATVPLLAKTLGITSEELLDIKEEPGLPAPVKKLSAMIPMILNAVGLAMGVAVLVGSIVGGFDSRDSIPMLSVGLVCVSFAMLRKKDPPQEKP